MARLIKPLNGVPNGEVYPREIPAGAECPPELEDAAREIDALESDAEAAAREKAEAKAAAAAAKDAENK